MDGSPAAVTPLLLRNLLTSLFVFAEKPLLSLAEKHKVIQLVRYLIISVFLFLLRFIPYVFPSLDLSPESYGHSLKVQKPENYVPTAGSGGGGWGAGVGAGGNSGIARALSQLLSIVNNIPVSSRKYEVVRSLTEKLIDENHQAGSTALREVNCTVLSAAFSRTLSQLEVAVKDRERNRIDAADGTENGGENRKVNWVWRSVRYCGDLAWNQFGKGRADPRVCSAEKLAAEVLWLSQKMAACECAEEAVSKWASATHLASLALSAEPRLQGHLVKVSAFLFTQAKGLGSELKEESKKGQQRQTKMRMLMSWMPLLCRASNGTDAPVLSVNERTQLERTLEDTIETLEQQEEQERVLSLWLHHFTYCPSADWPNLHGCYNRWCTASRKLLLQ